MTENMARTSSVGAAAESLRKRNTPIRANSREDARRAVIELNALEEKEVNEEDRKTFGRTPGGTGEYSLNTVNTLLLALNISQSSLFPTLMTWFRNYYLPQSPRTCQTSVSS